MKFVASLLLVLCACAPSAADVVAVSARAASDSAEDKDAAQNEAVEKVVREALDEEGLAHRFDRRAREELVESCVRLCQKVRWRARRGRVRFSAKIEREDVRAEILSATNAAARAPLKLEISLSGGQAKDPLALFQAPLEGRLGQSLLKVDPQAKLVVSAKLTLSFTPFPAGSPQLGAGQLGYLDLRGTVRIVDNAKGRVLGAISVRGDRMAYDLLDRPGSGPLPQPRHSKGSRPQEELEALYLDFAGRFVAVKINQLLNKGGAPAARAETLQVTLQGFDETQTKSLVDELGREPGIWKIAEGKAGFTLSHRGHSLKAKFQAVLVRLKIGASVAIEGKQVTLTLR